MVWVPQESFASGEIAPSIFGRVTSDQYRAGCKTLTNGLLTATGSARKRFGTEDIVSTTSGYPAALFAYVHGGRRFVIQFVSEDDDAADLNTTKRVVKVLDAETRAFIDFGDAQAHGPFDAFADNSAQYHHFTASELSEVYAFQDGTRITFCHPSHPPIFLERRLGDGGEERWRYGIAAAERPPKILDHSVPASLTYDSGSGRMSSSAPIFTPNDVGTLWRLLGAAADPAANPYGFWVQTTKYKREDVVDVTVIYGGAGADSNDWCGPYGASAGNFTCTITGSSASQGDTNTFTITSTGFATENHQGIPFVVAPGSIWIILDVTSSTSFSAYRLSSTGGTVTGSGLTCTLWVPGQDPYTFTPGDRSWWRKYPIFPSNTTGTITLYNPFPLVTAGLLANDTPWLPAGHETEFDVFSTDVGGAVFLSGGFCQLTGSAETTGGLVYTAQVRQNLAHKGPSLQWGLGWSHGVGFPRCGVAHQNRHFFAGFDLEPRVIVGSQTAQPDNFRLGDAEDDALLIRLSDPTGGVPVWMESAQDLLIGTTTSEFTVSGTPLTGSNLAADRQTGYGGNNVRPLLIGSAVLFASAHGIREMAYLFDRDRYESPDLTQIARHLFNETTSAHIARLEYLNHPLQTVYILDAASQLFAMSYYRELGIVGFSPFTQPVYPTDTGTAEADSVIESMAAVRFGGSIADDELWVVRSYVSGGQSGAGSTVRRIERMSPDFAMDQSWTDSTPSSTALGAAPHLIDLSQPAHQVGILLDGVYIGDAPVDGSGNATYSDTGTSPTEGVMGRKVPFTLVPLIQFPEDRNGATQGRIQSVKSSKILLIDSKGGRVEGHRINKQAVPLATVTDPVDAITAWRPTPGLGEHGVSGDMASIEITQDVPYHFEVAAVSLKMTFGEQ